MIGKRTQLIVEKDIEVFEQLLDDRIKDIYDDLNTDLIDIQYRPLVGKYTALLIYYCCDD